MATTTAFRQSIAMTALQVAALLAVFAAVPILDAVARASGFAIFQAIAEESAEYAGIVVEFGLVLLAGVAQ